MTHNCMSDKGVYAEIRRSRFGYYADIIDATGGGIACEVECGLMFALTRAGIERKARRVVKRVRRSNESLSVIGRVW